MSAVALQWECTGSPGADDLDIVDAGLHQHDLHPVQRRPSRPVGLRDRAVRLAGPAPDQPVAGAIKSRCVIPDQHFGQQQVDIQHIDDPVAAYIRGYEKNRKHEITIGHVLSHRAGVPNLPRSALDLDRLGDQRLTAVGDHQAGGR